MGSSREIVFYCDYGGLNGLGHLTRCVAVAQEARARGWRISLWTRSHDQAIPREHRLAFDAIAPFEGESSAWRLKDVDVLVVDDMYREDRFFETIGSCFNRRPLIVGMDDMRRRRMGSVDIVVNAEPDLSEGVYDTRIQLLGEKYCQIRKGFIEPAEIDYRFGSDVLSVFVMIGGTDPFGLTEKVLDTLFEVFGQECMPIVVIPGNRTSKDGDSNARRFRRFRTLSSLSSGELCAWMSVCRFAVIACGSSAFELASRRVPFLGLEVVDNQELMARQINRVWGMPTKRCRESAFPDIREELRNLRHGACVYRDCSVDLDGSARLIDAIEAQLKR